MASKDETPDNTGVGNAKLSLDEDETLKYQLLGPSLTKAGQDAVDQRKVSEIIYNASKGSKFFNHEQNRDRVLTVKIERILKEKARLEKMDLSHDLRKADELISELESTRDLSQYVVHVDCDAFFAAVEELDRPELKTVPMAVGKGVLSTCNYEARKYGCRSGMATFVAMKLCPHLICLPQNYEKYTAKAQEIRAIFAQYDPLFESASIDEAYLNITSYCNENNLDPEEAVSRMRAEVLEKTKIFVSAGIAANAKIAKISSNRNKPNGQFRVPNDRDAVMEFMKELPVRKVNGVGRVFERELDAIGIKSCGDIWPQRAYLTRLFGEKAFQFLIQCYLGLGRTQIQPVEKYERKSVGTERTFNELGDKQLLRGKLWDTAQELEKDLARNECKGRTLVLKVKLASFEVLSRQCQPPRALSLAKDLHSFALPMLAKLEREIPNMKLRLLGLRCTNLVSTKKVEVNFFGPPLRPKSLSGDSPNATTEQELSAEEAFEQAARQERQDDAHELEKLSQELCETEKTNPAEPELWNCPICSKPQIAEDRAFNEHVDFCLSRETIREAVQDTTEDSPATPSKISGRKRKATKESSNEVPDPRQKRLFFT
ncbi:Y-family DNA polymerase [Aspergillus clavatus NRRL 1]|uniref:DNA polymerase kappa n=1 Tax=Aspergillus clavatus (strain ATCC 1007 / CBS 513.65 / DSM 816 / NCTC 3887 / NRRL 1 / QM 1276 / 107) TaxID=344612 RepID=A1CGB3_ASPCL|nr:DNA-directed polymerase kappa, putative [Aspergillus clavatus NRRL 1]EAW10993.1 DNA-directed polymerase kappa, putative [Aspergillus clavatus NRRL 1]